MFLTKSKRRAPEIVVEVEGGLVTDIRANFPIGRVTMHIVDWDVVKELGEEPDFDISILAGVRTINVDSEDNPYDEAYVDPRQFPYSIHDPAK